MKILFVTDQFFNACNGYTITARRFRSVLEQHGHEVRVAAVGTKEQTVYAMKEFHLPFVEWIIHAQGMTFAAPDRALLKEAIAWADIVHFVAPFHLSRLGRKLAEQQGKPYTAAFHVQPENITFALGTKIGNSRWINNLVYAFFRDRFFNKVGRIHCPSAFIAKQLESRGYRARLHVISNGIDPDFTEHKTEKPAQWADRFVILMVGRLSNEKRQDILIRAVAQSRYADRIQLVLAGQGHKKKAYETLAKKLLLPLPPVIRFYEKDALLNLIGQTDLYVHASDAEIEAMSCMEAFACGRVPVIANSKNSATPQFALDDRSLFAKDDPADLAKKIDYWIEHPAERAEMEHAYAALGKHYALEACVNEFEAMFAAAIRDKQAQQEMTSLDKEKAR